MSLYSYKGMPVSDLLNPGNDTTFKDKYSEVTNRNYELVNNSNGTSQAQSNILYSISGTDKGPSFTPVTFGSSAANGFSWGRNRAYYSSSTDDTDGKGYTNYTYTTGYGAYVIPPYAYSKVRCILIGGGGGGGGGGATNGQNTGASGGSPAYYSFDMTLDSPHASSTLKTSAGGSGNGGRGSYRGGGGAGGIGAKGGDGAPSTLVYYSGVNGTTTTVYANGGGGGRGGTTGGNGGAGGTAGVNGDTWRVTDILKCAGYAGAGDTGGGGPRPTTSGPLYNTALPLSGTTYASIVNGYNSYGTTNIPYYWYVDTQGTDSSNLYPSVSSVNEGVYYANINNTNETSWTGGIGGRGGGNYGNDSGAGGNGGSGGYARVYFII